MNSMFCRIAPASRARLIPSAVAIFGFVVYSKICPRPPVARTIAEEYTIEYSLLLNKTTPLILFSLSLMSSVANVFSKTFIFLFCLTLSTRAVSMPLPVASPPECKILLAL